MTSNALEAVFCRCAIAFLSLVTLAGAPVVAWGQQEPPEARQVVNRSVLSVGADVYTRFDAEVLLALWNTLSPLPVKLTTRWSAFQGLSVSRERDLLGNIGAWPDDAVRLLFVTLVWAEAKKLNLFVPTEKDFEAALAKFDKGSLAAKFSDAPLREYVAAMPDARLRELVSLVLRAQTYERVRGGIRNNLSLTNVSWFWHFALAQNQTQAPAP